MSRIRPSGSEILGRPHPGNPDSNRPKPQNELYLVFTLINVLGYVLSIMALAAAIFTLSYFKNLHVVRNYIHLHAFCSFLLHSILKLADEIHSYRMLQLQVASSTKLRLVCIHVGDWVTSMLVTDVGDGFWRRMLETKCLGDKLMMLLTVLAILVTKIHYLFTLTSNFCHQR